MTTYEKLKKNGVELPEQTVKELCHRFSIKEMAVFGSSLRDDFGEASDVDFLVSFRDDAQITLFDILALEEALKSSLHRDIDVVERESLSNPIRRKNILNSSEVIYAAG